MITDAIEFTETEYDVLLDTIFPDDIEALCELTDDPDCKYRLTSMCEFSKECLDHYGRYDYSEAIVEKLQKLFGNLQEFLDDYTDRLEVNASLVNKLETIVNGVPDSLWELIDQEGIERISQITPMHIYKQRAVAYAQNIKISYDRSVKGRPLEEIDYVKSNEYEVILCVLNGIFGFDVEEGEESDDPLLSISAPLKSKLTDINNQIRERVSKE